MALVALTMGMVSCGGGKTPEQIQQEAQAQFDKTKSELQVKADEDCNSKKAGYVQTALDSIKAANAAVDTTAAAPATK